MPFDFGGGFGGGAVMPDLGGIGAGEAWMNQQSGAGGIEGAGPLGALSASGPMDLEALIFAVMSMRLNDMNGDLERQVGQMKTNLAIKNAYQGRIDELRGLIAGKSEHGDVELDAEQCEMREYYLNPETGNVESQIAYEDEDGTGHFGDNGHHDGWTNGVNSDVSSVKTEIDRLQGKLDGLNADSEIDMMRLNQTIARRQQVTTLFSNMMSNFNQTAMSVISNIK